MENLDFEQTLAGLGNIEIPTTPEGLLAFINGAGAYVIVAIIASLFLLATWGWRLFRLALPIEGALIFGLIGSYVAPIATGALGMSNIGPVNLSVLIIFVLALIGALLMKFFYKFAIVLIGAAGGWGAGSAIGAIIAVSFPDMAFFAVTERGFSWGALVVSGICALIVAALSVFIFKGLYIVVTSVCGMISAAALAGISLFSMTEINTTIIAACGAVGIVAGIICCVHQFRTAED